MLTAVAAWMIFQLRRHKLDDYRARYRIWVVLAIAAAFSSFEASSSGLMLLGMSIDGWTRKEIGYGGFPLVLASFASIIGVMGIRLCSELKSAPMSVVSWLLGLLAWAASALLGTGLLKTPWSPATTELVVGGCLLGGILAVFQASGIYLRQTYIHAQKRFLVRNGANLAPIQWKVPKLSLRRRRDESDGSEESNAAAGNRKWKLPWSGKRKGAMDEVEENGHRQSTNRVAKTKSIDGPQLDQGLTKKRGWFGIGGNRDAETKPTDSIPKPVAQITKTESRQTEVDKKDVSPKPDKRSFWSRGSSTTVKPKKELDTGAAQPKRGWVSRFSKSQKPNDTSVTDSRSTKHPVPSSKEPSVKQVPDAKRVDGKDKKSWLLFASRKPKDPTEPRVVASKTKKAKVDEPVAKTGRRGLFGMLDGLKLKPPSDENSRPNFPGATRPMPIKQGQQIPSTLGDSDDDDGDDDYSGRPMSKADRKKLRRQQLDDRRAA